MDKTIQLRYDQNLLHFANRIQNQQPNINVLLGQINIHNVETKAL